MSTSTNAAHAPAGEKESEVKHFLVIDDDRGVRHFLRDFLQIQGCLCETMADSTGVMDWLSKNRCDAIVLDLNLGHDPDEGFGILQQIRQQYAELPIVILTGAGYDEGKLQTAIHDGANGYISKTIPPEELFAALMRAVRSGHH